MYYTNIMKVYGRYEGQVHWMLKIVSESDPEMKEKVTTINTRVLVLIFQDLVDSVRVLTGCYQISSVL